MNIGGLLTATDFHLGDSLTYSLTGADAGCFDIVSASGQLRTTSGADYDYETRSSYIVIVYNVIVTIDDEQDIATIVVSITVTAISKNSNAIATCRPATGRPSKAPTVTDEQDDKLYLYNLPDAIDGRLASLSLSDVEIDEFLSRSSRNRFADRLLPGATLIAASPTEAGSDN